MTSGFDEGLMTARSLLFVPGDRSDRFGKAVASGADGLIIDLEDSVAPSAKERARDNARRWLDNGGLSVIRINPPGTPWHDHDLTALPNRPVAIMLPKTNGSAEVEGVLQRLPNGSSVIPMLETAVGLFEARAICCAPGVIRVAFGNGDFAMELGIDHTDREALRHARCTIVLASAAAHIAPPLDGPTTALDDRQILIDDTRHAASLGFTGRLCIHPRQVPVVQASLGPTAGKLRWAERVVAAASDGSATTVDGAMVDKPILDRARRLLGRNR